MSEKTRIGGSAPVRLEGAWDGLEHGPRKWQADALPIVVDGLRRRQRGIVSAVMGAGKSVFLGVLVRLALPKSRDSGRVVVVAAPSVRLVNQLADTLRGLVGADAVGVFYGYKKQPERDVVVVCNASVPKLAEVLAVAGRRVSLLVLDEAHKSECATVRDTVPKLAPAALVGMTATPFRSVPKEVVSLFDVVWYRYTLPDAVRDGVLVPPRVVPWDGAPGVDVDDACLAMIRAEGLGPGVVSATSIEDADSYAHWLSSKGVPALAIHSGHNPTEQAGRIAFLRDGQTRCLVHVSLLAEGVDFPWLRWICLRRRVQASVRFLQESGRVLRSHPGKSEGVILDPHLLMGRHGWVTPEAIGSALEEAAEAEGADRSGGARMPTEPKPHEVICLDVLVESMHRVHNAIVTAGLCEGMKPGAWQMAPVTEGQVDTIRNGSKLTRHIPKPYGDDIRQLKNVPWALTRGQASALLDVLYSCARYARSVSGPDDEWWRVQVPREWFEGSGTPPADAVRTVRLWGERVKRWERTHGGAR